MFLKRLLYSYTKTSHHLGTIRTPAQSPALTTQLTGPSLRGRFSSSVDFKDDPSVPGTTSLFNIKKTIKSSPFECADGFTCIRTVCPVCHTVPGSPEATTVANQTIYINKTTGTFTCSACRHLGRWEYIEKFFLPYSKSVKTVQEMRKLRDVFLDSKKGGPVPVEFPDGLAIVDEKLAGEVCQVLGLDVSF